MAIESLAVIGAGTMGRGIAEAAAVRGLNVVVVEISDEQQAFAQEQIRISLEKGIKRGKLDIKDPQEVLQRIIWQNCYTGLAADFVIEAVPETESLKTDVLQRLDALCHPNAILATNTSSISVTRLAAATNRPDKVVGMHFFNPVPIMEPVEIVQAMQTSPATLETTRQLAEQIGKKPFTVQDSPGFVVNRILMPLINEAMFTLQEGVADASTIDSLMKLGCNHPMGPLQLADLVGLDVCLSILRVLHDELGDPKFRPCPLLVRMVDAGKLGRKTRSGFYTY
jgi:3-hydroxybutyryl-CoA dehydrogenase